MIRKNHRLLVTLLLTITAFSLSSIIFEWEWILRTQRNLPEDHATDKNDIMRDHHSSTSHDVHGAAKLNETYDMIDVNRTVFSDKRSGPKPKFIIKLLAYSRTLSAYRALKFLKEAYYDGDKVDLEVYVDHSPEVNSTLNAPCPAGYDPDYFQVDSSESLEIEKICQNWYPKLTTPEGGPLSKLNRSGYSNIYPQHLRDSAKKSHALLAYLTTFEWPYGRKTIHFRSVNVGLKNQWIEGWFPSSEHEFAYFVEDDVVVSKFYYRYLKKAVHTYYYDTSYSDSRIFGISTQKQAAGVCTDRDNRQVTINLSTEGRPYLFQSIGTWGQLLFPKHWIEFRLWYDQVRLDPSFDPLVAGTPHGSLRTNEWYLMGGEKLFTPYFIRFLQKKKWFSLYVNFPSKKYLSASHQEQGVSYGRTMGMNSGLVLNNTEISWPFPVVSSLIVLDTCAMPIKLGEVLRLPSTPDEISASADLHKFLKDNLYASKITWFIHGPDNPELFPIYLNAICNLESKNVENFIFVVGNEELARKLQERSAPVIIVPNMPQYNMTANEDVKEDFKFDGSPLIKQAAEGHDGFIVDSTKSFKRFYGKHNQRLAFNGEEQMRNAASYRSKIFYAVDLVANCSLHAGYNVIISSVLTTILDVSLFNLFSPNTEVMMPKKEDFPSIEPTDWVYIKSWSRTIRVFNQTLNATDNYIPVVARWRNGEIPKFFVISYFNTKAAITLRAVLKKQSAIRSYAMFYDYDCCMEWHNGTSVSVRSTLDQYYQLMYRSGLFSLDLRDMSCNRIGFHTPKLRNDIETAASAF